MNSTVIYKQQIHFCGKPQCRKCREGIGHGPYWYAYHTTTQGRTVRTYLGKRLPTGVQATDDSTREFQHTRPATLHLSSSEAQQDQQTLALLAQVDEHIAQEAFSAAIGLLDQLLASNPTSEATVQRLIFVLARLKRRGEAIRAYQQFANALASKRLAEPSTATSALIAAVQRGDTALPVPLATQIPDMDDTPSATPTYSAQNDAPVDTTPKQQMRTPTGRNHQRPLVGRATEMATLREYVFSTAFYATHTQHAQTSTTGYKKNETLPVDTLRRPQYLMLLGDAGIGKTRLVEEVSDEAQERGYGVIWSRGYAQESGIPYRQWIEALRNANTRGLWQISDLQQQASDFAPLALLLPELYDVLPHLSPLPPQREQQRLWEAVLALFVLMSRRQPLLVMLDDLQWADASSCELPSYLARRLSGQPVVFIGACRESELAPDHVLHGLIAHMQREHTITTLAVQPLSNDQVGALVGHLPDATIRYIQTQAAGNPFFAEELAHSLGMETSATPALRNGKQALTRKRPSALPGTIIAALDHRIGKLSRPCQQLLANAAVLGGSFEFTLIRAMEASGTNQSDEDTILDLLDEALQAGVLAEEGRGTRISYHFWHPLLVNHLYERLSATKRALLHRRVADILQQTYARREEEGAATITHHLIEGGAESERIAHFAELAGKHAHILSAYPDAERYYRIALEHSNNSNNSDNSTQRALLLERLGECTRVQGHFADAQQFYEQLLTERTTHPALDVPFDSRQEAQIEALLWCEVGWTYHYAGQKAQAIQCRERGEQALRTASVTGGPAWATLRYQQGMMNWQEGNYNAAHQAASEAQRLFEEYLLHRPQTDRQELLFTRIRRTLAGDPVDLARIHRLLGSIANSVGHPSEGLAHLNAALAILEEHDHKREIGHVCCNVGYIHLQKAEYEQARSFLRRSLTLAEQVGDTPLTAVVYSNLGLLSARTGTLTEADDWFRRALQLAEQIHDSIYVSMWNSYLSEVLRQQGKLSEASRNLCYALKTGRKTGNIPCIGLALVATGNLRIAQAIQTDATDETRAKHRYLNRASVSLHHALALEGLEAETRAEGQLALAHVALLQDHPEEALHMASSVLTGAREHELSWLLTRAEQLMQEITPP